MFIVRKLTEMKSDDSLSQQKQDALLKTEFQKIEASSNK